MTAVDESAKLEIIETIGKALGLHEKPVKGRDPIQFAAGALLTMPAGLWAQATLVRGEPMGHGTLAGLHPVLRAMLAMDDVVWETLGKLRPKFSDALREENAIAREF